MSNWEDVEARWDARRMNTMNEGGDRLFGDLSSDDFANILAPSVSVSSSKPVEEGTYGYRVNDCDLIQLEDDSTLIPLTQPVPPIDKFVFGLKEVDSRFVENQPEGFNLGTSKLWIPMNQNPPRFLPYVPVFEDGEAPVVLGKKQVRRKKVIPFANALRIWNTLGHGNAGFEELSLRYEDFHEFLFDPTSNQDAPQLKRKIQSGCQLYKFFTAKLHFSSNSLEVADLCAEKSLELCLQGLQGFEGGPVKTGIGCGKNRVIVATEKSGRGFGPGIILLGPTVILNHPGLEA